MPVLRFKPGRVEEALKLSLREALELVEKLKVEVEVSSEGYIEMEIEVDRPDMYSLEGIARQVNGLLERETGLPSYSVAKSGYTIHVDDVPSRPYIAAAVVWDVNVDEDYLEELIQFQEKLHTSLGGRRELVAIGLHDLDKLPSKNLRYRMEDIDSIKFVPLSKKEKMSLRDVLTKTEQGITYGSLSLRGVRHPVLYAGDEVISVPPVINAELTRIEPGTKNIFVDVTGTNHRLVLDTVSIIAANLAERSVEKKVGTVEVTAPWGVLEEPQLRPRQASLSIRYAQRILGSEVGSEEAARHLRRMRFDAIPSDTMVLALVPRFRIDIIHPVDLVEEIMLSIGLEKLAPVPLKTMMRGSLLPMRAWEREARKILVGMGFVETLSYTLVSCDRMARLTGARPEELVRLLNPIGTESSCMRNSLLPQLVEVARSNQHRVPIKIFEIGEVYSVVEAKVVSRKMLAMLIMSDKAGFEDIQAALYSLIYSLGDRIAQIREYTHPLLIEGRSALLETLHGIRAVIGEVKPDVLEKENIEYPVAVAELDYSGLAVPRP